jgi:uncharacterized protein (DUF305 family)
MSTLNRAGMTLIGLVLFSAGCGKKDDAASVDTAVARDTAAGMAAMPGMNRPPAKDADHEFLRNMIDHHEGFIQMAMAAMTKASTPATQGDAHNGHTKQAEEQKKMIADVQAMYGETVTPMVMPQHKAMNDSLQAMTGADYDRAYYRMVVAHHREGIRMTDAMLPRLMKPEVKKMAETMKADQQKEITAFERKARG